MKLMQTALWVVGFLLAGVGMCVAVYHFIYPYGRRPATIPCMYSALNVFAADHDGWFPRSTNGPHAALAQLYPEYCEVQLAGLSGDISATISALKNGGSISNLTSWTYIQGFKRGDPGNMALLWESRGGRYSDGRRNLSGGRSVLFVDGTFSNVQASAWAEFLRGQEKQRVAVFNMRTNSEGGLAAP